MGNSWINDLESWYDCSQNLETWPRSCPQVRVEVFITLNSDKIWISELKGKIRISWYEGKW